jgi:PEP-CTERM motif
MTMKELFVGTALAATLLAAHANGSILVANPGPLNSFDFDSVVFNGTSGDITKITFDLSTTPTPIVFGGLGAFDVTGLGGGTATPFGAPGDSVFGFTFTGFDAYENFRFTWDPDTATDPNYGATVAEFVGTDVKADVDFSGASVIYGDTVSAVGPDMAANLTPVPEPSGYALMLAGLVGVGFVARRRGAFGQ